MSSSKEEGRKSALSAKTDDSDWSDIDTDDDAEDETGTECNRLKIDLDEEEEPGKGDDEMSSPNRGQAEDDQQQLVTSSGRVVKRTSASSEYALGRKSKPVASTSSGVTRSGRKKNPKPRASKSASATEVPSEVMTPTEAESFHSRLECAAKQLRLNRTQVKSVIRRLVESPDLYNLILEKAGDKPETELSLKVEPRITRKVAKEVVETGGKLNWFLDKVSQTPQKVREESAALLNVEFPDDESDQEYDPLKDPEAMEALSDDDSVATGTPTSSIAATDVTLTPMSGGRMLDTSDHSFASTSENKNDTFKRPLEASKAVRSLNFDQIGADSGHPSMSPRLTRSKASLKQVTIEELESKFVPCDITPDMYDTPTIDDDYSLFLAETFNQPIDLVDDTETETDPDPDFVYQESEELKDVQDEFENNRSTKISQKEVDELLQELFEAYELDKEENKMAKKHKKKEFTGEHEMTERQPEPVTPVYEEPKLGLTPDQAEVVAHQMRQHIQLLTQMAILSSKNEEFAYAHADSKEMLSQLVNGSFLKPYSMFAQDNLFPSLSLISEWEKHNLYPATESSKRVNIKSGGSVIRRYELSKELMDFIGNSNIIIYPQLLPTSALQLDETNKAPVVWSQYEDNLLAIGLEMFSIENRDLKKLSFMPRAAQFIVKNEIVRCKTTEQVKIRLKNMRSTRRMEKGGAIAYWMTHGIAPRIAFENLRPYHPGSVTAPRYAHASELPANWQTHFNVAPVVSEAVISTPKASTSSMPFNTSTPMPVYCQQSTSTTPDHVIHFSPSKMTFTLTTSATNGISNMPSFVQTTPIKNANRLRPIAIRPGSSASLANSKFPKSQLKKQRDRLLKKYSPMKKRRGRKNLPPVATNSSPKEREAEKGENSGNVEMIDVEDVELNRSVVGNVVAVSETATQITILDAAIQECGIDNDDMQTGFHQFDDDHHQQPDQHEEFVTEAHEDVGQEVEEEENADKENADHEHLIDQDQVDFEPTTTSNQASSSKRKTRQQREAETTLQLLEPEMPSEAALRREQEALELVVAAKETLTQEQMMIFFEKVVSFKNDSVRAFGELHSLCLGHPDLQEMLLDLLTPSEAMSLGSEVYFQFTLRSQMKIFFHKIRVHYANQPSIRTRILKEISMALSEPNITVQDLQGFAAKVFKSNQHLHEEFVALFPKMPFPESLLPECEQLNDDDSDYDPDDPDESERIEIPVQPEEANFGGDNCPCACHLAPNSAHCIHCSIKFINGKVYSRGDGKILRPVRIIYPEGDNPFTRLKKSVRKRPRKLRREMSTEMSTKTSLSNSDDVINVVPMVSSNGGDNLSFGSANQEVKMDP